MPTSATASVPWTFLSTPVYVSFWFAALPTVVIPPPPVPPPPGPPGPPPPPPPPPVLVPPVTQPPVSPGAPGGMPAPVGFAGLPNLFVQTGVHPVFLHPKPTYRPVANLWDVCLREEWALWKWVRPYLDCQAIWTQGCVPEDWETVPPDMVVFNPVKSLPVPLPADGDVPIIKMYVPTGYDGLILAHFHSVDFPGGQTYAEGSGDLVWRLNADGRYVRDMGNMVTQEGSPIWLDPIPGGQFVKTGNLVEYTVAAPNGTGTLPAGGVALAGLHGWFWPRG